MTVWVVSWWNGIQGIYASKELALSRLGASDLGELIQNDLDMWLSEHELVEE